MEEVRGRLDVIPMNELQDPGDSGRSFVTRVIRHDRRSQTCRLTAAGTALLRKMEKQARAAHLETLDGLTKAEQKRFIAMMQKIVAMRSAPTDPAPGDD